MLKEQQHDNTATVLLMDSQYWKARNNLPESSLLPQTYLELNQQLSGAAVCCWSLIQNVGRLHLFIQPVAEHSQNSSSSSSTG